MGRDDGNRERAVVHRIAAARIDDVAIASAGVGEMPQVIAGGRHRVVRYGHTRPAMTGIFRLFQADVPGLFLGRCAMRTHILPEVHQHPRDSPLPGQREYAVHGILFANPAEVEAHPFSWQENGSLSALDVTPSHPRQRLGDCRGIGYHRWTGFPIPQPNQGQRGGVKHPSREKDHFLAEVEERFGLRIHVHPLPAGAGVDAADEAVGDEARVTRLEPGDPAERLVLKIPRQREIRRVETDAANGVHGLKHQLVEALFGSGLGRAFDPVVNDLGRVGWIQNHKRAPTVMMLAFGYALGDVMWSRPKVS